MQSEKQIEHIHFSALSRDSIEIIDIFPFVSEKSDFSEDSDQKKESRGVPRSQCSGENTGGVTDCW